MTVDVEQTHEYRAMTHPASFHRMQPGKIRQTRAEAEADRDWFASRMRAVKDRGPTWVESREVGAWASVDGTERTVPAPEEAESDVR